MNQLTSPLLDLLKDVGRFVSQTLSGEKLSEKASAQRQGLVQRLSIHLPETFPPASSPPYLDMTSTQARGLVHVSPGSDGSEYVGADKQEYEEEEYEECPEPQRLQVIEPIPPPYPTPAPALPREDSPIPLIPYSELRETSPKNGPLHRKERVFFMEPFRRYFVALHDHRLCFYGNDRDSKPCSVMNLEGFQARPAPHIMKDQRKKEKDSCFEIVCPGRKTTQLMARTPKDMEQWVAVICAAGRQAITKIDSSVRRQLPSIPNDSINGETYDDIETLGLAKKSNEPPKQLATEDEEEEIYHDISVVSGPESDQESLYDDIVTYPTSVYYNTGKEMAESKPPTVNKEITQLPQPPEEEEEDIYDDIETLEATIAPLRKPQVPNRESSTLSKVQSLALSLQASMNRGMKGPLTAYRPPTPVQTEDIYELVDSPEPPPNKGKIRPTLPMKPNLVR